MSHADYCAQFVAPSEKVLDVGSGQGKFLCEMAERGFAVYGVETNPAYIAAAAKNAQTRGLTVALRQGKGEHLPFSEAYFDFVNCAEVTEHVDNPKMLCQEIWRVMKQHGKGYVSFHNRFGGYDYHYHLYGINWLPRVWAERLLRLLGKQKEDGAAGRQRLTTMHYYTYADVKLMLLNIGFTVHDIREIKIRQRYGRFSFIILLLYKAMLRPLYFNTFHMLIEK